MHTGEGLDVLPSFCSSTVKRMFVAESCVCGFMFTRQCRVDYIEALNSVVIKISPTQSTHPFTVKSGHSGLKVPVPLCSEIQEDSLRKVRDVSAKLTHYVWADHKCQKETTNLQ